MERKNEHVDRSRAASCRSSGSRRDVRLRMEFRRERAKLCSFARMLELLDHVAIREVFDQTCSSLECDGGFETVTGQNSLSESWDRCGSTQHAAVEFKPLSGICILHKGDCSESDRFGRDVTNGPSEWYYVDAEYGKTTPYTSVEYDHPVELNVCKRSL